MSTTTTTLKPKFDPIAKIKAAQKDSFKAYLTLVHILGEVQDGVDEDDPIEPTGLEIQTILPAAGKSQEELVADVQIILGRKEASQKLIDAEELKERAKGLVPELQETEELLKSLKAEYERATAPALARQQTLRKEIKSLEGTSSQYKSEATRYLFETASPKVVEDLRKAGSRAAVAGNRLNEVKGSPGRRAKLKASLTEDIERIDNQMKSRNSEETPELAQRWKDRREDLSSQLATLEREVPNAQAELDHANEAKKTAEANINDWRNFRLSSEPQEPYFGNAKE